jgi:hypothetical protein
MAEVYSTARDPKSLTDAKFNTNFYGHSPFRNTARLVIYLVALRFVFDWLIAGTFWAVALNGTVALVTALSLGFSSRKADSFVLALLVVVALIIQALFVNSSTTAALLVGANIILLIIFSSFLSLLGRDSANLGLKAIFWISVLSATIAAIEWLTKINFTQSKVIESSIDLTSRYGGLVAWPQIACLVFSMALLVSIDQTFVALLPKSRFSRFALRALLGMGIVATSSVTALVGLSVGILWMFRGAFRSFRLWMRYSPAAIIALGVLAVSPAGQRFISDTFQLKIAANQTTSTNSFDWRILQWNRTYQLILQNPFFGRGSASAVNNPDLQGLLPHNDYLRISFEYGFVGLLCALFVLYLIASKAYRESSGQTLDATFPIVLLIGFTAFGENLFDQGIIYLTVAAYLALLPKIRQDLAK